MRTYRGAGIEETHELVARIAPCDYQVFLEPDFEQQFTVMQGVGEHSGVPMAKMYWLERDDRWFGNPFWIMERVSGPSRPTHLRTPAAVGCTRPGPTDKRGRGGAASMRWRTSTDSTSKRSTCTVVPARSADPLGWQLDYYDRFLAWAEDGTPHPLAREALACLRTDRPAAPPDGPAVVWGDA